MKLDWRESSDKERWYANIEGGQLIISQGYDGWFWEWIFMPEPLRNAAMDCKRFRFEDAEAAKQAVEQWYFSQVKEKQ